MIPQHPATERPPARSVSSEPAAAPSRLRGPLASAGALARLVAGPFLRLLTGRVAHPGRAEPPSLLALAEELRLVGRALDQADERLAAREAELASTEALFRGVFDHATDVQIVHRVRPDGTLVIETCNHLAARTVGRSREEVQGMRLEDILPAAAAARIGADIARAVATGEVVRREEEDVEADGTRRIWEVIHVPLKDVSTCRAVRVFGSSRDITHLRRAEADSREANRLLRMAEGVAHVGHWRLDHPEDELFWSEEVFRIYGVEADSYYPTPASSIDAYHPDDRGLVRDQVNGALRNGFLDFTARLERPDGEMRNVLVRGFCQFSDGGGRRSLFGVIMDVTELRRAEARLGDNAAMLKVTLDNMDQGLIMVDPSGRVPICNQRALELLELPAALMASHPRLSEVLAYQSRHGEFDLLSEEEKAQLEPRVPGEAFHSYERRRPNGTVLEIRTAPLPAGGVVQTFTDMTAHREAEKALRATEARYRLLADYGSDLIVLGHSDGHLSYISPAVKALLGFTIEEAQNIRMRDWIHPDDTARLFAATAALTPDHPEGSVTYRLRHKNGTYIWAEAAFRRVEGEGGRFTVITAIRDATERQQHTEELRMARDAAELARSVAENASRAKTDFLAAMSHEIRTPLNSIIGFADLLATSERLAPDLQRYADLVRSSGSALLTVVNDILDFSKVEAGAIELHKAPFDPVSLIDNCLSIARGSAVSKALGISARCDPNIPRVLIGDEGRLRQILLNLLNNAIKFTREGLITLTLRHEGSSLDGENLRFSVTDTGIGIPSDKQHRLFQRFSQIDGSIKRDFGGTGLGLAICKRLVDLMGGEIGVCSEYGQGATFWLTITLPRGRIEAPRPADPQTPALRKRGHLLLVEDAEVNQELARLILETVGHTVDVVSDGAAAVAAVQARRYDLVLMDVQMPGMDGLTATQAIRQLDLPVSHIPIIAMTANVLPDQVRQIWEAGMDDHVGKPISRPELFSTIERWLPEVAAVDTAPQGERKTPAFDRAVYDNLTQLLGPETVARLAGKLHDELLTRFIDLAEVSPNDTRLRHDVHVTVPAAGMLGFFALSTACLSLHEQDQTAGGRAFEERLDDVRSCRAAAIDLLARLSAGAPNTGPAAPSSVH